MNVCDVCGYKIISNARFELHKKTHVVNYPDITVEVAQPVPAPERVDPTEDFTINFTKDVEITINGRSYNGREIKVKDMGLASEIVRIARTAYGRDILA